MIAQEQAATAGAALGAMGLLCSAVAILFGVVIYFVPLAIAAFRSHPNTLAIAAVNVLLGWSFIGWVVALVWALTNPPAPTQVFVGGPPPVSQRRASGPGPNA